MLKLLSQNPQRKYLSFSHGLVGRLTICENPRELRDFRKPSTIFFLLIFDAEIHRRRSRFLWKAVAIVLCDEARG